jgi:hypothetical protein
MVFQISKSTCQKVFSNSGNVLVSVPFAPQISDAEDVHLDLAGRFQWPK